MKNNLKSFLIAGTMLFPALSFAQSRLDVPGLALGRSTVASSRGIDAMMTNPANIGLHSPRQISFIFPNLNQAYGNNFLTLRDIKKYFGGDGTEYFDAEEGRYKTNPRTLTDAERDELAASIDNGELVVNSEIMPIAILLNFPSVGAFGFALSSTTQAFNRFPAGTSDIFKGYLGTQPVELTNAANKIFSYTSYQLSYGRTLYQYDTANGVNRSWLDNISAGVSLKLIRGHGYLELNEDNHAIITPNRGDGFDSVTTWATDLNYQYKVAGKVPNNTFTASNYLLGSNAAGTGFGVDIGATMTIAGKNTNLPAMAVGFSVMDIGSVNWDQGAEEFTLNPKDTITSILNLFRDGSNLVSEYQGTRRSLGSLSTSLPTRLRLGGAAYLDRLFEGFSWPLVASLEYSQGFNDVGINTTSPRVGLGLQYTSTGLMPTLRTGLQFGGIEGFLWSGGIGWNIKEVVQIDLSLGSLSPVAGIGTSQWVDLAFRVRADIGM